MSSLIYKSFALNFPICLFDISRQLMVRKLESQGQWTSFQCSVQLSIFLKELENNLTYYFHIKEGFILEASFFGSILYGIYITKYGSSFH